MPYIIDGHNLIPHVKGLELTDIDDELSLINLLGEFSRINRKKIHVFFDKASPGYSGKRRIANVFAVFVPDNSTADDAIIARLYLMGKEIRNWTVVSSDRKVQVVARSLHARVQSSEEFARELLNRSVIQNPGESKTPDKVDSDEVRFWLEQFKSGNNDSK